MPLRQDDRVVLETRVTRNFDDIITKLRLLRIERGLSLEKVAARIGYSYQMVQKAETGEVAPHKRSEFVERYAEFLNTNLTALRLFYEDENALVAQPPFISISRDDGVSMAMLSLRDIGDRSLEGKEGKTGSLLFPYLLRIKPGHQTKVEDYAAKEVGILLDGCVRLMVGVDGESLAYRGFPTVIDLYKDFSYTLDTARHYLVNTSTVSDALLLMLQLSNFPPLEITKPYERMLADKAEDLPLGELIAKTDPNYVRTAISSLMPYPHEEIPFHRDTFSEELLILLDGDLEFMTRSPTDTMDRKCSKFNNPLKLTAPSAVHYDGRILHTWRNPNENAPATYVHVQRIDLMNHDDAHIFLERNPRDHRNIS